ILIEGEFAGTIFAYPFIAETLTSEEEINLKKKLIECGATENDASIAIKQLKRLDKTEKEYLHELVELVVQEVNTFHHEIEKREARILELNSELGTKYRYHSMIGKSKKMQLIYRMLERICKSESTVLIQGENGTGKELVAKAIHYNSPRKDAVLLAQNCSAFNDNLLDSELFGHVKGAFTGAIKDKKGLFEMANGGTLFLDEIGDTSLTMQVKLLRVLQEGTFLPVGATQSRKVNVRIIAATNRDLKTMIVKGEFREDLYYRINVLNILLPPLRERKEDISILFDHFMEKKCAEIGQPPKLISKKCLEKIIDYAWPGNVRELENEIERIIVLAGDNKNITPEMLSQKILDFGEPTTTVGSKGMKTSGSLKDAMEELEDVMISEGLKRCNFNKSKLAKELGISRASLITKVEKYGLDKRSLEKKKKALQAV
ncbi:MAG: sigma-54-dependent Fis family transcriptional regulator, partial [Oligoflexia bacterium]|nr:sigma-54-dependent Fis family transcriptional regulator [Oligoflexia bacterium]